MQYTAPEVYEFISKQTNDPIIEWRTCHFSGVKFAIFQSDKDFFEKVSPMFDGKKYMIPLPTLCPEERQRRRLIFRNERKLYRRQCDFSQQPIISMYAPEKQHKVYDTKIWFSDKRNAKDFGQNVDYDKNFSDQFHQLLNSVPQISLIGVKNENCDYNNCGAYNKNCYLSFDYGRNEDSGYLSRSYRNNNCFDLSYCLECERCFNLLDCSSCTNSTNLLGCESCQDCNFCYECKGCTHCFLCANLLNQQYCIKNKSYTKEEYESEIQRYKVKSQEKIFKEFDAFLLEVIHRSNSNISCEKVFGDYLKRSKGCNFVFGGQDVEDCKYSIEQVVVQDTHDDCFSGNNCFLNYETIGCENTNKSVFCFSCWSGGSNLIYCHFCHNCKHCFGCSGLKDSEYCIFNKQYSQEEYENVVPKIISHMQKDGEWGGFFPPTISPFGYNESLAQEYFPLTREDALAKGYKRMDKEYTINIPDGTQTINTQKLPNMINEVSDDILSKAIICEVFGRPFRIVKPELEFYRKHGLPLPRKHPDIRHQERLAKRPGRILHLKNCDKCGIEMLSVYDKNTEYKVYCEKCYQQEVYG